MTHREQMVKEYEVIRVELEGLNPRTSTWAKLKAREKELERLLYG